jgi:hypothetical protein
MLKLDIRHASLSYCVLLSQCFWAKNALSTAPPYRPVPPRAKELGSKMVAACSAIVPGPPRRRFPSHSALRGKADISQQWPTVKIY